LHLHTCAYIICTAFIFLLLSPPPPPLTSSNSSWPTSHGQNEFCPPVPQFCRRKNIKDVKRNMAFLLALDKDCYTWNFLVLFPYMYVLQPQLAHLYKSSSLFPSPLPMVVPASLRFL
jgi:hypothetical protein